MFEQYQFAIIYRACHILNEVFLLCRKVDSYYNHHYHSYEITNIREGYIFINIGQLLDYHPLGVYKINDKLLITLEHYVT